MTTQQQPEVRTEYGVRDATGHIRYAFTRADAQRMLTGPAHLYGPAPRRVVQRTVTTTAWVTAAPMTYTPRRTR